MSKLPPKLPPDKHCLTQYRVCSKTLALTSTCQGTYNIFKMTLCCTVFSCLHVRCARKFAVAMDSSYKFDILSYENDETCHCITFFARQIDFIAIEVPPQYNR